MVAWIADIEILHATDYACRQRSRPCQRQECQRLGYSLILWNRHVHFCCKRLIAGCQRGHYWLRLNRKWPTSGSKLQTLDGAIGQQQEQLVSWQRSYRVNLA